MGSRLKEDEKNERVIRGLLKLPANRKCINCNSLGPQYVCITFWTFICTNCSGIHREFTHRVKSVSMAKFTTQEVSSLQEGGNERAKDIYLKELDASCPVPDGSNVNRLRDFIKHVYVDRRYTGERSSDKPPSLRMGDKQEPYDNRREDSYHSSSRSPAYEGTYERRYSDKASPSYEGGRSPGYDLDSQRKLSFGSSPARSGVVNDWKREDRFANGRRAEDDSSSKPQRTGSQKDAGVSNSSLPAVRPVREILGDSAVPLRVIEPPRDNTGKVPLRVIEPPRDDSGKVPGGSSQFTQRTSSSSSLVSSTKNPTELKKMDSLIDFDTDPAPQPAPNQVVTSSDGENWACFDNAPGIRPSQTRANVNPLGSMLTQLSVPPLPGVPAPSEAVTQAPSANSSTPVNLVDSLFAATTPLPAQVGIAATLSRGTPYATAPNSVTILPNNNASLSSGSGTGNLSTSASGWASTMTANGGPEPFPNMQHPQQSLHPGVVQGASRNPVGTLPEANVRPTQPSAGVQTQPDENKSSGRKELPADIFTSVYPSYPRAVQGWQTGLAPHMRYPIQYNPAMLMSNQFQRMPNHMQPMPHHLQVLPNHLQVIPNHMQQSKSTNPFDAGGAVPAARPSTMQFPSMAPLQGALPNMTAPTGMDMGMAPPSWMPPQPTTYQSFAPHMTSSYGTIAMPPGTYMGQQLPGYVPSSRNQGFGGTRNDTVSFGSFNPAPSNPSRSGNPFA